MSRTRLLFTSLSSASALLVLAFCSFALAGCAGFSTTATTATRSSAGLSGVVHGGQQPVTASHIYLFEIGTTGYGTAATNIGGAGDGSDVYGNYVLTGSTGSFNLTQYTCANAADQTYLLAYSGNPGGPAGTNNLAITLIAALGTCGNIANLTNAVVNEVSTVAAVTALQQYMTSITSVGTSSTNVAGLNISAALVGDVITLATGKVNVTNQAGTGVIPQAKVDSLGNSLAACVNSTSAGSSDCAALFSAATPPGGTAPTDVATAMLNIARNPTLQVNAIYVLPNASASFQPTLSTQPTDWGIGIAYSAAGMTSPQNVVIDAGGAAWVSNCPTCAGVSGTDSLVGFSPAGAVLANYTAGIHMPTGIAFDNFGNLWSTNLAVSGGAVAQVVKMTGATIDFAFNDSTIVAPTGIALDANNNAWVTMQKFSGTVVQVLSGGTRTLPPVQPSFSFYYPDGIGIDGSGNIFAAGTYSNDILKLTSAGAISANYTSGGLDQPIGISLDHAGNVFTINNDSSLLTEINGATGVAASGSPFMVGVSDANVDAIDGAGTSWIADYVSSSNNIGNLIHISAAGVGIGTEAGLQDPSLQFTSAGAIDGSGNVWVTNPGTATVTEFLGLAVPVVTPIAVASATNRLGVQP